MNKERIRNLVRKNLMTKAGLKAVAHIFDSSKKPEVFIVPTDIMTALKRNKEVWENFQKFPKPYQRIRISFVEHARNRGPEEFNKRLNHLIVMSKQNKRFGFVKEMS
jgi:hypothetical protein